MQYAAEERLPCCTGFSAQQLDEAIAEGRILQSTALVYDTDQSLRFSLGGIPAVMPHEESADGICTGEVREIAVLTRVGRATCFVILRREGGSRPRYLLSRARAQRRCREEYLDRLVPGDIIRCTATHIEPFGVFCDVGCGISALLPIDCLSVSRIASPADRVQVGQELTCVVRQRDERGRLVLSMKELLGTWAENAALFKVGMSVVGTVRSVEDYGIFIELTPNLTGLAEYGPDLAPGDAVSVYIKNILPEKMKVKLVVLCKVEPPCCPPPARFFLTEGHLDSWVYSTPGAKRLVQTVFDEKLPRRNG